MTQPDDIDKRALGRIEAERPSGAHIDRLAPQIEGLWVELVQTARRSQRRASAAARDRDVDRSRDGIDEALASQSALEAERGPWHPR